MDSTLYPDGQSPRVPPPVPCHRGVYLDSDYSLTTNAAGRTFFQPKKSVRFRDLKFLHHGKPSRGTQPGPHVFALLKLPTELRNEVYRCALFNRGTHLWTSKFREPGPESASEYRSRAFVYHAEKDVDAAVPKCSLCCREAQAMDWMRRCEGGCDEVAHEACIIRQEPKVTSIHCRYRQAYGNAVSIFLCPDCRSHRSTKVALLRVNKQVHRETTTILYGEVTFLIEISSRNIIFLDQDYGMTDFRFTYLSLLKKVHIRIHFPFFEVSNYQQDYTLLIRDNVRNVCMQLARFPCLRQLVIEFGNRDDVSDDPTVVVAEEDDEQFEANYAKEHQVIMSVFGRLRNVGEVNILDNMYAAEDCQLSNDQKEAWVMIIKGSTPSPAPCKLEKMYMALRLFARVMQDPENSVGRTKLGVARRVMENGNEQGFYRMKQQYEEYVNERLAEIKRAHSLLVTMLAS